jgi:hypothetical protein
MAGTSSHIVLCVQHPKRSTISRHTHCYRAIGIVYATTGYFTTTAMAEYLERSGMYFPCERLPSARAMTGCGEEKSHDVADNAEAVTCQRLPVAK